MTEDDEPIISRTQSRQEARAVTQLGLELIKLAPSALDRLALPDEVREAVDFCQQLKLRARARQKRLIAQLLRAEDHVGIKERMMKGGGSVSGGVAREKQNEQWYSRLIEEGDSALQDFVDEHSDVDRQQIRTLIRSARLGVDDKRTRRARRELSRVIREVRG
ncbi:MAG: hypothetical protein CL917_17265 [Deltaproteobacteria bacterium]|nr:hypothetical protein [Deltaproteobacteria bacterium]